MKCRCMERVVFHRRPMGGRFGDRPSLVYGSVVHGAGGKLAVFSNRSTLFTHGSWKHLRWDFEFSDPAETAGTLLLVGL